MIKNKYIWMLGLSVALASCDVNNELPEIEGEEIEVGFNTGNVDLSNYVAVGASFTAGFTDGALFIGGQENSFPNILASKFALGDGGDFNQPLMNDNIGGLLLNGEINQEPRFYFDGSGPARLDAVPTTEVTSLLTEDYHNYGIPGAKSFHLVTPGYSTLNPYFGRFASSTMTTVLADALAKAPTFFTLSEIGGNDVLGYALDGGAGEDQSPSEENPTGNLDPSTYGNEDITNPLVFASVFNDMVSALTANGAKGIVSNVPYITSLANFTTVPYNPIDPSDADVAAQIPILNTVFGGLNDVFIRLGETERVIEFSISEASPVVIYDENLEDISETLTSALINSADFPEFISQFGLSEDAAPLVANLLGSLYGQSRQATADDLLVLASSAVIGEVNTDVMAYLISQGLSETLAGQFSVEGLTNPLGDKWVLTPEEQTAIKTATDAYNGTIASVSASNPNIAMVDLNSVLTEAATSGIVYDDYTLTTNLVTGGLISLDGVHLTSRGYSLMANKMLEVMDTEFGTNFTEATNGLAKANDYPTNYSPLLR